MWLPMRNVRLRERGIALSALNAPPKRRGSRPKLGSRFPGCGHSKVTREPLEVVRGQRFHRACICGQAMTFLGRTSLVGKAGSGIRDQGLGLSAAGFAW